MSKSAYAKDGVDIEMGDNFSAFAAQVCRSTFTCSRFVTVKDFAEHNFRGPRGFRLRNLPEGYSFDIPSDGIGTKVGVITEALGHHTAAQDLFAMAASDISRYGGLPLVMANVLDVSTLGEANSDIFKAMTALVSGLGTVCRSQGVVLMRGETAELGPFVASENPNALTKFNWSCSVLGAYHPRRIITGKDMRPGDIVMALRENSFRSNGLSSVRKALARRWGPQWWLNPEAKGAIKAAAEPSVLYDKFLAHVNGWYDRKFKAPVKIKAIAHISGGGIPGKFAEDVLFPLGLSAQLYNLWEPLPIMRDCFDWHGAMSEEEAYRTWNGGQGMLVVIDPTDGSAFLDLSQEHGIRARAAGMIFKSPKPWLALKSGYKGCHLVYRPKTAQ